MKRRIAGAMLGAWLVASAAARPAAGDDSPAQGNGSTAVYLGYGID
jgi:hypothetical protein